jgi:tRNA1(Val) A37 N6-methylase TrmN6
MATIETASPADLDIYFNTVLNKDRSTYTSSNDEPTPMACVAEMLAAIPEEVWRRPDLKVLDPCCGNGNFGAVALRYIEQHYDRTEALETVLEFGDINAARLDNVRRVFCGDTYALQVYSQDFLAREDDLLYDLVMANPPYARILEDGARAAKNHNMIGAFVDAALARLKPDGYVVFITPDNWMSRADRNTLALKLSSLHIVHLDIHGAKRHFKKIGSSFTWYVVQNRPYGPPVSVSGVWKRRPFAGTVTAGPREYIPLLYTETVRSILAKTVDAARPRFGVQTSSDLHKYTKADLIVSGLDDEHPFRLIHTPKQTVWASRPHKFQEGWKAFISTTDKYACFADDCGMTQSIAFVMCDDEEHARRRCRVLMHPLFRFINNICRWGNFNNIRMLQCFPEPDPAVDYDAAPEAIYEQFGISPDEVAYIEANL